MPGPVACEGCGTYWSPGQSSGPVSGCPNCGQPYRGQPNPVQSEMEMRNMPAPGGMNDTGGNPLQEGIYADTDGGWKNRNVRDESYASVHSKWYLDRSAVVLPWHLGADFEIEQVVEPGPATVEIDAPGQPLILQHEDPDVLDRAKATLESHEGAVEALPLAAEGLAAGADAVGAGSVSTGISGLMSGAMGTAQGLMSSIPGGSAVMGLAKKLAPGMAVHELMGGGGGGAGAGAGQADAMPSQPRDLSVLTKMLQATFGDEYETPSSVTKREDTDDPEHVDPHEKDDGDHKDWQKEFDINGIGGTDEEPGAEHFNLEGPGVERFMMLLPLVMKYFNSEESGENDPLLKGLHEALEAESPGYLDHDRAHNPQSRHRTHEGEEQHVKDDDDGEDDDLDANDIEKESGVYPHEPYGSGQGFVPGPVTPEEEALQSSSWPDTGEMTCPHCGAYTRMHLGGCPQCGQDVFSNGQDQADHFRTAGAGPHNPEQFKAVKDLLEAQGRGGEVINLIDNPDAYADEMAQVQQKSAMPDIGSDGPPMPAEDPAPPSATMPMPAPQTGEQQMMAALHRHGADNLAEKCPKCDSHTTGYTDDDDTLGCHACGHHWKGKSVTVESRWVQGSGHHGEGDADEHITQTALPAADQQHPEDVRHEHDSAGTWTDESGAPLTVGQQYQMYSDKYDIPDRVLITDVQPHAITYQLTDVMGVESNTTVPKEEADLDGLTFVPVTGADAQIANPGMEENLDYAGQGDPNQQTDLSSMHQYQVNSRLEGHPDRDWLNERTAGAKFTPMEQRTFIDERGEARNRDRLDLSNTHYNEPDLDEEFLWAM